MKSFLPTIFTLLFFTNSFGQSANSQCNAFNYGSFEVAGSKKNLFVFRDFGSWYEFDADKRYRYIFDIIWVDECNFYLEFNSSSLKNKSKSIYSKGDTLRCQVTSIMGDTINILQYFKENKKSFKLIKTEIDVFSMMSEKDKELRKSDKLDQKEMKEMFGPTPDSLTDKMDSLSVIVRLNSLDITQMRMVQTEVNWINNQQYDSIYRYSEDSFKELVSLPLFKVYAQYIIHNYGTIQSYSVLASPFNYKIGLTKKYPATIKAYKYILKVKFSNVRQECFLTMTFVPGDEHEELLGFNISQDDFVEFNYINELIKPFFGRLINEQYEDIYKDWSDSLKITTPFDSTKTQMISIFKAGGLDSYKLSNHQFIIDKETAMLQLVFIDATKSKKIILYYTFEGETWKLGAINSNL